MTCGIYCITNNINGKKYIGQSIMIDVRLNEHKRNLKNNKHSNIHLQNAWNKYGGNAFEFNIIKCCKERYLNRFEKMYIRIHNTFKNGYNRHIGGGSCSGENALFYGRHHSEESKKKISEANKGACRSEETKQRLSLSAKERFKNKKNHPWYGRNHSEETKKKISQNHADFSGKNHPNYGKHLSEETKKKISVAHKGYKPTPETLKNMSEAQKRRFVNKENHPRYGTHNSKKHRINISKYKNSSGILNVGKTHNDNCSQGFNWTYWYYDQNKQKSISAIDLLRLKEKVLAEGFEWVIVNEDLAKKSLEESTINIEEKYKNHRTGILRVYPSVKSRTNQGFCWNYTYRENNKYKTISSVDLYKLKEKVLKKGLEWIVVNESIAKETFKKANKQYNDNKYKNHKTGVLGVYKSTKKDVSQGFLWSYNYMENGKRKIMTSVDPSKLKEKMCAKGFEWNIINEETAKENGLV